MNIRGKFSNLFLSRKSMLGILISFIGLYWAFNDFEFNIFVQSLYKVKYMYILYACLFLWFSVWIRAIRWRYLFNMRNAPPTLFLYKTELIGYFGNNILPLRLGELMRAYIIGKEWNLPKSYVFGTVIMERLLDTITLLFISLLLILLYPIEQQIRKNILIVFVGIILIIIMIYIFFRNMKNVNIGKKINIYLIETLKGVASINLSNILPVTLTSLIIWAIYLLDVYLIQYAFNFNLNIVESLAILVFSSLALAIPSAPGMFGTFHLAVKYTVIELFGILPQEANSFSIILHSYGYVLLTLLGAYYFIQNQVKIRDINANI